MRRLLFIVDLGRMQTPSPLSPSRLVCERYLGDAGRYLSERDQ